MKKFVISYPQVEGMYVQKNACPFESKAATHHPNYQ